MTMEHCDNNSSVIHVEYSIKVTILILVVGLFLVLSCSMELSKATSLYERLFELNITLIGLNL